MLARVLLVPESVATPAAIEPLRGLGYELRSAACDVDLIELIDQNEVDVVILAVVGAADLEPCRQLAVQRPDVRVIAVADNPTLELALEAMRAGAFDLLELPLEPARLQDAVHRAIQHRGLREEVRRLRTALAEVATFEELVGSSPPMLQLYELLEQAARSQASVLITGESGTGKELVARALHSRSSRRGGPFVAVNCSAIPENLLESELFGHVRGAFTDARQARQGLFAKAAGGTLFLDEIGEMPLALQPKLLRVLQEKKVRPVGGDAELPTDVRLITATNRDLEQHVADGRFREDLFYRINVIQTPVPPLRERGTDILLLAQHYAEHFALLADKPVAGLSPAANRKLLSYPWPGNVRELQNCIERAVALTGHQEIQAADLPERIRAHRSANVLVVGTRPSDLVPMHEVEKRYIARVLLAVGGNKREAARILGFDRKTLYRKLDRYDLKNVSANS